SAYGLLPLPPPLARKNSFLLPLPRGLRVSAQKKRNKREELIDFLNSNSGIITVIFSGIVALSTLVYAILTWQLVSETRRMRKVQSEPALSMHIQPRNEWINFMDIIIENVGSGPARDVTFKLSRDFQLLKDRKWSDLNIFKNGINYLAPGQKIQFLCTDMEDDFETKKDLSVNIEVKYTNISKKKYKSTFILDFSQYLGIYQVGKPPLEEIEKHLKRIQKDLNHFSTGFKKLKVDLYTTEDRKTERDHIEEVIKKQEQAKAMKNK
ncbi:hypothetical protein JW887_04980, partial [Candidatus Dojkabacteria bacterium]|nr:hypothetical protein [Candidatus Dojkabacteria bacterium]